MSATVMSFDAGAAVPSPVRAKRLREAANKARTVLEAELTAAGIEAHYMASPVGTAKLAYIMAEHAVQDYYARRVQKLERAVRVALASEALSADTRAAVLGVLRGQPIGAQPALAQYEPELLAGYRALSPPARAGLRRLLAELTGGSVDGARGSRKEPA